MPRSLHFPGALSLGAFSDGKAQVTREPTGHPEADGAWGPPGPPRPRPARAGSGPFPGPAATGPFPRIPSPDPATVDPWSGTTPGYEFEGRRSRPGWGPRRIPPGAPPRAGRPRPELPRPELPRPESPRPESPRLEPPRREETRREETRREAAAGEPRRFRYTPTVSQPLSVPPQAWPENGAQTWPENGAQTWPGDAPQAWAGRPPRTHPSGPLPRPGGPSQARPGADQPAAPGYEFGRRPPDAAGPVPLGARPSSPPPGRPGARPPDARRAGTRRARPDARAAGAEWARLLHSMLPQPVKRRWSSEFVAGLEFKGWGVRVAIPILAMVVFGVAVVVIAGANSGNSGPTPPATSLGFPPATLAGNDFAAAASARGITQTLGRVTSVGDEVVAVGSQAGARIARAQFFVSADDGRSWTMGTVRSVDGGMPPPGRGAILVAGGQGAWVALGPGSIWTSADGRTWTLAPGPGMPLLPGDQINAVQRTADGFIAVGANVPGGDAARSTPVVFLSANGITWQRLDAARLHLAAGTGHALDVKYAAAAGKAILIAGDIVTTEVTGKPKRTVTVQAGAAWLSTDGGSTWTPIGGPALAGARPQVAGAVTAGNGFVLLRPATVAKRPVVDVYFSPDGLAWTFEATLTAAAGFTADMVNGGPDGAVVTGQTGRTLTAFISANGRTWQQTKPFGTAGSQAVSGAALAPDGAVVATGIGAGPDSRQPLITVTGTGVAATRVDIAKIPGAVDTQLAVNGLAAQGSTQVAVGSANGFPAAWTSVNGGISWTRATGATSAVLSRPGSQQLTGVTHGIMGWLAVGGVTASAAEHPVVVVSADGSTWQAADGEQAFAGPGLFTQAAAANSQGYVIVGYQRIKQVRGGKVVSVRTVAAAWWSAALTGWQRAGAASPAGAAGALDGLGARQMTAVAASSAGFVAVGSHGDQPSAWTSADGRTWRQVDLPLPVGSVRATLQHVASSGRKIAAVGTAVTTSGQQVPFAASSSDGGTTWIESALPAPAGLTSVTALAAAGGSFIATGTYGSTPGHQNVVVWTSPNGSAWRAAEPAGQGLTGPGIQAITSLAISGSTLTGVGFTASPASEDPVFWQSPVR